MTQYWSAIWDIFPWCQLDVSICSTVSFGIGVSWLPGTFSLDLDCGPAQVHLIFHKEGY
jgi:hypothetical protein